MILFLHRGVGCKIWQVCDIRSNILLIDATLAIHGHAPSSCVLSSDYNPAAAAVPATATNIPVAPRPLHPREVRHTPGAAPSA